MRRRRFLDLAYVLIAALPLLAGFAAYWLIVFVDPYGVRPWGKGIHLDGQWVADRERPLLVDNSLRQPHDLVLFGASTTMAVSNRMLQDAYGARTPLNISFIAPRPVDYGEVLSRIETAPALKRVVLVMDFTLLDRSSLKSTAGFDRHNLQSTSWSHGGDFSLDAAQTSLSLLFGPPQPPLVLDPGRRPEFMSGGTAVTQSAATMRRFVTAVEKQRQGVFGGTPPGCDSFPFIAQRLVPFVRQMHARHVPVDVVFPAYPYVLYYDWTQNLPRFGILRPGGVFVQLMSFKRCVVTALRPYLGSGTAVVAPDSDDALSGDLHNYMDSGHLLSDSSYETFVHMAAQRNVSLTERNLDAYEASLRKKIAAAGSRLLTQTQSH